MRSGEAGKTRRLSPARGGWPTIAAEIVLSLAVVYVSLFNDWPRHEYFRFLVLLPIYQAGFAYGYTGGVITSFVAATLMIPALQLDPSVRSYEYGIHSIALTMVFYIIMGLFSGGVVGGGRRLKRYIELLSRASLNISTGKERREVMELLVRESAALLEAREGMALVWAARSGGAIASNHTASDPRFVAPPGYDGELRSVMAAPAMSEGEVYGAALLAGSGGDDGFSRRDLSMLGVLANAAGAAIRSMEHEKKRQEEKLLEERMKDLFSRYVSAPVAEFILKNPDLMKGGRPEVTILVSDIRGFTKMSESLSPRLIVEQLNEYFTRMVDVVFAEDGAIDKFIGDCIVAYWGAPAPAADHAARAARAALAMSRAMDELNAAWRAAGRPAFDSGIGLHTGRTLMGNLGDERKKSFTILGPEVNRAMAVEALTRERGRRIIVSAAAAAALPREFDLEKLADDPSCGSVFALKERGK